MTFPDFSPTMGTFLRVGAARHGDRLLITAGGQRCTYAEADARSRAVAKGLVADGVGKGTNVGILLPNSVDWAIAFYAVTRIGAVAVPINTFFKARELAWVLRDADVAYLVSRSDFLGADYLALLESALPELAARGTDRPLLLRDAPFMRAISVWDERAAVWSRGSESDLVARGAAAGISDDFLDEVEACVTPADRMVIVYSSGSTADPKGAIHTHGTVVRHSMNVTDGYKVTRDDVMFSSMPFFWVGGLVTGLLAVQHHGAALVTMDAFEPGAALDLLERERATIALGWPQQGKTMSEHPSFADRDLSSVVRTSLPDIVPPERRFPEIHPESLGMTEACSSHLLGDPYVELGEERRGNFGQSVEGL
ncbi:MAG TPA: class I adenylate-forming enzyme family protein, partial [Acidimicrobiia bacterium]|nr:class I adenylate-forming enzyme family protein [Acidimicrobiia bacterium]